MLHDCVVYDDPYPVSYILARTVKLPMDGASQVKLDVAGKVEANTGSAALTPSTCHCIVTGSPSISVQVKLNVWVWPTESVM